MRSKAEAEYEDLPPVEVGLKHSQACRGASSRPFTPEKEKSSGVNGFFIDFCWTA
jgi:hypothetical protein